MRTLTVKESQKSITLAAKAADAKKAENVIVMDMSKILPITDFFLICGAQTPRQVKAISQAIEDALAKEGSRAFLREGRQEGTWILLDYIDFVVHVFRNQEREYYQIERLWKDAPLIEWWR